MRLAGRGAHGGMILRHLEIAHIHELDVEDEVGPGGNAGVGGGSGTAARTVGELPGNEETALAAYAHSVESLIEAGNDATEALWEADGRTFIHLWLSIGIEFRFAIRAHHGAFVVVRGIEFAAIGGEPSGVVHFVDLVGLGLRTGADLYVLVAKTECRLHDSTLGWNARGQLHAGGCGGRPGSGVRGGRPGRGLSGCGHAGGQKYSKNALFHCERYSDLFSFGV